jgi:DNA-binding CsgD family transcriptional regulator
MSRRGASQEFSNPDRSIVIRAAMAWDLLRGDQVRKTLLLIGEAREIGSPSERRLHLLNGVQQILGAAMTSVGTLCNLGPGGRGSLEEEVTTPDGPSARALMASVKEGVSFSPALGVVAQRLRQQPMVTARRRDVVSDRDWYRSESFNQVHRAWGFDDCLYSLRSLGGGRASGIAIRREWHSRAFDEEDRNVLALLHEQMARLESRRQREDAPRLSRREGEVLQCLLRGASEKEVAADLCISPQTVHSYVKTIYQAHGVRSRAELLCRCLSGARRDSTPEQ